MQLFLITVDDDSVDDESDNELSTGAAVAITFVVTFIITLVVTALVSVVITSLYYKHLIDNIKKSQVAVTKDIKSDDPVYARGTTIKMDTNPAYGTATAIKMDTNPAYATTATQYLVLLCVASFQFTC